MLGGAPILTNDLISDSIVGNYTNNGSVIVGVNGVTSINVALAPLNNYGGRTTNDDSAARKSGDLCRSDKPR